MRFLHHHHQVRMPMSLSIKKMGERNKDLLYMSDILRIQMRLTSGSTVFIMMIFHLLLLLYIRKHRMVCLMVLKNI